MRVAIGIPIDGHYAVLTVCASLPASVSAWVRSVSLLFVMGARCAKVSASGLLLTLWLDVYLSLCMCHASWFCVGVVSVHVHCT